MKLAPRLIDLISKKKKNCSCSTLFLLISKKANLLVQHAFLSFQVAVVLDDYNAGLYDKNVKRPSCT